MIKFCFSEKEGKQVLHIEGSGAEILAELIIEVRMIYNAILEDSPMSAEVFKDLFKTAVEDDIVFSSADELMKKMKTLKTEVESKKKEVRSKVKGIIFDDIFGDDK